METENLLLRFLGSFLLISHLKLKSFKILFDTCSS